MLVKLGKLAREGVNRGNFGARSGEDVKQAMKLVNLGF